MEILAKDVGNVTTDTFRIKKSAPSYVLIQASGTFGGATVKMQSRIPGLTYMDLDGFAITVDSMLEVKMRADLDFRFVISGGTATSISIGITGGGF